MSSLVSYYLGSVSVYVACLPDFGGEQGQMLMKSSGIGFGCANQPLLYYVFSGCMGV